MWIKICGIRDEATAMGVAAHRPDAVGLNFYRPSPRCVSNDVAARIVATLPAEVEPIGLFVNATVEEIRRTVRDCGLRAVQLHGDETVALMSELADLKLFRAFRIGDEGLTSLQKELEDIEHAGVRLAGCLVEARVSGAYGGTGIVGPWEILNDWPNDWPPLILAGGLTPENVADGIAATSPWGVDVASGVESSPGTKDLDRIRAFIENARSAS